jgi:hypothetical protein
MPATARSNLDRRLSLVVPVFTGAYHFSARLQRNDSGRRQS